MDSSTWYAASAGKTAAPPEQTVGELLTGQMAQLSKRYDALQVTLRQVYALGVESVPASTFRKIANEL